MQGRSAYSQQGVSQGAEGVPLYVSVGADGKAMKSPDVLAKSTANGFGIGGGRWVGEAGGRQAGSWQARRDFHLLKAIYRAAGEML